MDATVDLVGGTIKRRERCFEFAERRVRLRLILGQDADNAGIDDERMTRVFRPEFLKTRFVTWRERNRCIRIGRSENRVRQLRSDPIAVGLDIETSLFGLCGPVRFRLKERLIDDRSWMCSHRLDDCCEGHALFLFLEALEGREAGLPVRTARWLPGKFDRTQ
ncbi:hypothetical protein [Natronoarchaeum rubrum]|uniref:hypothetical protein n=1 Tax=Natronoarchaeum rubrum TaxID=755311 RepID=UPI002111F78F|nr:hypothetical protein [Natronoarchaeum rubrum]